MNKIVSVIILLILISPSSLFANEVNLLCKDRNGKNTSEILLDTSTNQASINMNDRVYHSCEINKTAEVYLLLCPTFSGGPQINRNSLLFTRTIFGEMVSTSDCTVVEKAKPKI